MILQKISKVRWVASVHCLISWGGVFLHCVCVRLQVNPYLLQNAVGAFSPFLAQALAGHQGGYSEIAVGTDCAGAASNPLTVMVPASTPYTPPSRSHRSDRMEARALPLFLSMFNELMVLVLVGVKMWGRPQKSTWTTFKCLMLNLFNILMHLYSYTSKWSRSHKHYENLMLWHPSLRCLTKFCSPIDGILKLMTVWRITGKIVRTTIMVNYICTHVMEFLQF